MENVNAIVGPVVMTPMVLFTKPIRYMISYKKYVKNMLTKMSHLEARKYDVEKHMHRNTTSRLEVPSEVRDWLEEVQKICVKVEDFRSDVTSSFNPKMRLNLGRKAFKIMEEIEKLTIQCSMIIWTDNPIPMGKVDSTSTSIPTADHHDNFQSREGIFTEALKALEPNHKSHMIALCGMGGVGKTTMLQMLKKVVKEKKLFNYIVDVVMGEKMDPIAIQEAIANYLGIQLNEKTKPARADKIRKWFKDNSNGGKTKFLILLDDVWQLVDLNDIGLSPFPNQGVDFKILLTSRDRDVCTMMGVEANLVFNVGLLTEVEAQRLFWHCVESSAPELHEIGECIVRKCGGLPIAIKVMAYTLRSKSKHAWKDALSRLMRHKIDSNVKEIFEMSYHNLHDNETRSIFFLCGLFPTYFNIPMEELVRYGWGLKVFDQVSIIREARSRLNTCIKRLIHTNLLMKGDGEGCVKMHELVHAFVLDMFSKVKHASFINHGRMSRWPGKNVSSSCQIISSTCDGMLEFPRDLKFPNLIILKLMHGDKSLRFPPYFYEEMRKVKVISYDEMKYPLLPTSPKCSTNLRVLHLHQCSLMFDFSSIGNLLNLEVLSFANSNIELLPSTIRKLVKLRLLDLTGCAGLHIDNGVLKNLVKLEELYTIVGHYGKAISFTNDTCNELAERSRNLSALEFEFFQNNAQLNNMSFENLKRFKISMGRSLDGDFSKSRHCHSYKNTLQLVADKCDLYDSKVNVLFEKTEVLCLSVGDMNDLEDVEVKFSHSPRSCSFNNVRVLLVSRCKALRYVFTLGVAKALSKLEHLGVSLCDNMEELIHIEGSGEETVTFPKLKFLSLVWLRNLSGLCHNVAKVELPQLMTLKLYGIPNFRSIYPENDQAKSCLLKKEVVIPKLEKLVIFNMENLKEIWPCEYSMSVEVKLREIDVRYCYNLVNLFPCNPMPLLHHLEDLQVKNCGSIEVLFNIDLDCVRQTGEGSNNSSLRNIQVNGSRNLSEVWRIKGENNSRLPICGFQAVETITISECTRFKNIFTPTTINFDMGALVNINTNDCQEEEIDTLSEDTHVRSMIDVEAKAKNKAKAVQAEAKAKYKAKAVPGQSKAKARAKARAKAKALQVQVQLVAKAKAKAKALQVQTEAEAKTKAKAKAKAKPEPEIQGIAVQVEAEAQAQAQSLFGRFVDISDDADPELQKIAEDIVRKCCGIPIAIKTMALTLRNKSKDAWKDALSRLEHLDTKTVAPAVFEMSYDDLQDAETKTVFLLCGLFPKDFTIHIEELVRYGWGLKVFDGVYTIRELRSKLTTCIERLIHANLLMEGDDEGCVKMDDLVRAFILDLFSKLEHASIVSHGRMSGWPENDMSSSCQKISISCKSMFEFPRDLKFPNLTILKLLHGDKSLRFPSDFYDEMKTLKVISYDDMKYPLLPLPPLQCFNLRVLHLHECSLRMFDCSSIGNMLNLEVLSFANSFIEWLPSTIGNLVKLRLLDLTACAGLRIDTGVLKNLVGLEELYMIAGSAYGKTISFTDDNCNEIAEGSRNLSALEFEFFQNNAQPKNMSFENLERFKISVGRSLDGDFSKSRHCHSYANTLQLVTDKGDLYDSRVNVLFEKTEVLCLSVGDMNDLEDVEVKSSHSPRPCSFNNVRVLVVSRCEELRYVFTLGVAKALSKLEHLEVSLCDNMEELIHIEGWGVETVTFPKLKFLSLAWLQNLSDLCHNVNIIELPQLMTLELDGIPNFRSIYPENELATSCLLKNEVVIPNLEKLIIFKMENLKEIWPREFQQSVELKLRDIEVGGCDNLVNLFPCNPMSLLHHLQKLKVKNCGSVEVLFNIDLDFAGEIGDGGSSNLRSIEVKKLGKLKDVWRIEGENNSHLPIRGFQAVESLQIERCKSFRNVFTPTTTNFDLGALINMHISDFGESGRNNESVDCSQDEIHEINSLSEEDISQEVSDNISNVVFPSSLIHSFPNLRKLKLSDYEGVGAVFEIENPISRESVTTQDYQQQLLPYLENLDITRMERMSHVWKCNWHKFLFRQEHQLQSLFHNFTTIYVKNCESIKYLFSPLMVKLLSNLKKVQIEDCEGIEEVVSKRDDEDEKNTMSTSTEANTTLYPCLDSLTLSFLPKLKCIGGGANGGNNVTLDFLDQSKFSQVHGVSWTIYQYSSEISISFCDALSSVVPCYAAGQMQKLQVLRITRCVSMKEVFESQWINKDSGCVASTSNNDEGNSSTPEIPVLNHVIVLKLPMLRVLEIKDCDLLEHIFTFSTLQSLLSLEELVIWDCNALKVIVKEEHEDQSQQTTASECVAFPSLKSIELVNLPNLVGFFLGKNEFVWPSLDQVMIKSCPQMTVFAPGGSTAPTLKHIHTDLGKHSLDECGLNFHVTIPAPHQTTVPSLVATSSSPATSEGIPWSFHNLMELDVKSNISLQKILPSNELLQLQKLEKMHVSYCHEVEEIFEASEGTSSVVKLPNLTEVKLAWLYGLRNMWNSNQWTLYECQNLTTVSIHGCHKLQHVFTKSMVGCLLQLQELHIRSCDHMREVIVKDTNVVVEEKESDGKMNEIELICLRSIVLDQLPCLEGFCLWKVDVSLPLLDTLKINKCPRLSIFTMGNSATPELREIETSFGSFYAAGKDINSFINIKQEVANDSRKGGNIMIDDLHTDDSLPLRHGHLRLGAAVSKLSNAIIDVKKKTSQFSSELTQIQSTITRIKPMIDEINTLTKVLDRPEQEKEMFITQMKDAEAIILECKRIKWKFYKKYPHAVKLNRLNTSMLEFFQIDVQLVMLRGIINLQVAKRDSVRSSSRVPLLKGDVIGFDDQVRVLKEKVLEDSTGDDCSVVVVSAAGGCGKTTLVTMLCHDPEIKAKFGENIYFVTISETPNLKLVIKNLLGRKEADFYNDDDAINEWGSFLNENGSEILLVLDDVWSYHIINLFKFKLHGYKILATSRITFTQFNTYALQPLNQQDATNLFRYYAFSEGGSEHTNIQDDLVNKLVKCCKNHPLALSVIGGLLKGKLLVSWLDMLEKLSDGQQSVLDLHKSIVHCLARSLDVLEEDSVLKQCYMDLGLFPEDQKISATMLMDIWVHLYKHDEEGLATINHILELSYRNLAILLPIQSNSPVIVNYCDDKAMRHHNLLRTLGIRLSSQEPIEHRKRLIINANGEDLPQLPHTVKARIMSISTDERFSLKWSDIKAPKVEVFVLNFMSKTYQLPQFMRTMEELKVLIIINYGYNFSDLQNFPSPQYLSGLTTIRLEHVSISSISTSILELANLRKLSLIMCKIGNSFSEYIPNKLTTLSEIDVDSCDDLITFPSMFCNLVGIKKLSITNCHELSSLSEGFGNLTNLEVLRLASCSNLRELPGSMRQMQKLRVIDLSDCLYLSSLPREIGELSGLQMIHMRGCLSLHELPLSVKDLGSLEVVCDEEIAVLWKDFADVNVHLVER